MMTNPPPLDPKILRGFSPLDGLKNENLRALARKTSLRELSLGACCSRKAIPRSARTTSSAGMVELITEGHVVGTIKGGTPGRQAPARPCRCRAAARARAATT